MAQLIKDSDNTINLTLTEEDGTTPIDLTGLSGYVVDVFQRGCFFDQFSKNAQSGYRGVTETDAVNGEFTIYLNAANTANGKVGREVFYEIKTQAVNVNFDSGTEEKTTGIKSLGDLVETSMKGQTFA